MKDVFNTKEFKVVVLFAIIFLIFLTVSYITVSFITGTFDIKLIPTTGKVLSVIVSLVLSFLIVFFE